jgi:hypothetical protein
MMQFLRTSAAVFAMLAGLLSAAGTAEAALIVFSGADAGAGAASPRPNSVAAAASFDAAAGALGPVSLLDFESAPVGGFASLMVAPGVTITGAGFLGVQPSIRNAPFGAPDSIFGYNTTTGGSQFLFEHGGVVTFTFDSGVQAFGAYISGIQFGGETITFSDGTSQSVPIPALGVNDGGIAFVGFTDADQLITSITINATGNPGGPDFLGIDDVRFVSVAAPVPEPSTFFMVGTFLAAGLLSRARRASR